MQELLPWPHKGTDWDYMLDDVIECYVRIAKAISEVEKLIIIAPDIEKVKEDFEDANLSNIKLFQIPTNDTWARDFGCLSIIKDSHPCLCDFKFNAWGNKFKWDLDNQINKKLQDNHAFLCDRIDCKDFILEGGSVETDGNGIVLTTSNCLLAPTRNSTLNKQEIELYLKANLGVRKILWLDYGALAGDDTDSHIDTLARLAPNSGIVYVKCQDVEDSHYDELKQMEEQIKLFTDLNGKPFKLFPLPFPNAIYDENKERLPATYANYLILNGKVLVPTYGQPENDAKAIGVIKDVFPSYKVCGIDCRALIRQHGSLHCVTMQFADNTLK